MTTTILLFTRAMNELLKHPNQCKLLHRHFTDMGRTVRRSRCSESSLKIGRRMPRWRTEADCSRYEQQQLEEPGHWWWKGACDGQSVIMTWLIVDADESQSSLSNSIHQQDRQTCQSL